MYSIILIKTRLKSFCLLSLFILITHLSVNQSHYIFFLLVKKEEIKHYNHYVEFYTQKQWMALTCVSYANQSSPSKTSLWLMSPLPLPTVSKVFVNRKLTADNRTRYDVFVMSSYRDTVGLMQVRPVYAFFFSWFDYNCVKVGVVH